MAKRFKEKELREQHPNFDEILIKLLNEGGQSLAASQLGTTQSTISQIIKRSKKIERFNIYRLKEPQPT